MNKKSVIFCILLVLLIILSVATIIINNNYQNLQAEHAELIEEHNLLSRSKDSLSAQIVNLKQTIINNEKTIAVLQNSINDTKNPTSSASSQNIDSGNESAIHVWLSRTGTKYHSNPNCSNMKNPTYTTLENAIALGRGACSKCY